MVGQGPLERVVGDEIRSRGLVDRILVKGVTTEPEEFLAQVDLLLMTSKYEGRPNVVAEAASLATPVVSTNAGDVRLMAADLAGVTVVDSRDPEVLALALTNKGAA
jgi:glycosyltransferase involved in cell wall biosynthesis